jgi:hypothetical protein
MPDLAATSAEVDDKGEVQFRGHPDVLSRHVVEVDAGGSDLLQATVWEVQRCRPVIPT